MPDLRHPAWITILGFVAGILLIMAIHRFKQGLPERACVSLLIGSFWFGWSLLLGRQLKQRQPVQIPEALVYDEYDEEERRHTR